MTEAQALLAMLHTAPQHVQKHIHDIDVEYGRLKTEKSSPIYEWILENRTIASMYHTVHKQIKEQREDIKRNTDKWQLSIEKRHAQPNIDAVTRCIQTVDVPYKCNANLFSIVVRVPGYEHDVSRGHSWNRSARWVIKVPMTYHKNVQGLQNQIHTLTSDGKKWMNFITKYNPVGTTDANVRLFNCKASAFCAENAEQRTVEGWYAEQEFDDEVFNAFAYTEKRAISLLNKRVKAEMLSRLGI